VPHFAPFSKSAHQESEEIVAILEDEPSRTVLDWEFQEVNKAEIEAQVGSSARCFPRGSAGRWVSATPAAVVSSITSDRVRDQ